MDNRSRNLQSLKTELFDTGIAARGLKTLMHFMEEGQHRELADLLRDHRKETVYEEELNKRFEIDALIEGYNVLLVAVLSGFISPDLDQKLRDQIKFILSNESVQLYYQKYYPYKFAEYTLQYVKENKHFKPIADEAYICCFTDFISLNRMLDKDEDIEMFLNMLDFVFYGESSIDDIIEILSSPEKLRKVLTQKNKSEEAKMVWGFFKYTSFLSQFKNLIEDIHNNPLLPSAMWLYHGYYFDRMNIKMKSFFEKAFQNIRTALTSPLVFSSIAKELYGEKIPPTFNEKELQIYAEQIVQKSEEDVLFVLNPQWRNAIQEYFEGKV